MTYIQSIVKNPWFLSAWAGFAVLGVAIVGYDLVHKNAHLMPLMKLVWLLTVAYSGLIGVAIYWNTGRKQIPDDGLWRRSFRSVAHCYSGCGLGEIIGVMITVGILGWGNLGTGITTFILAFAVGFALTLGPLLQDGVELATALRDTVIAETPSIALMEVVAIGVDLVLAGSANLGDIRFWSSLVVSLTCGLFAAYPVNVLLVHFGVKEGMMDPRMTH